MNFFDRNYELFVKNIKFAINQILNGMHKNMSPWRDYNDTWAEGPWDKESWSDNWGDSHGR